MARVGCLQRQGGQGRQGRGRSQARSEARGAGRRAARQAATCRFIAIVPTSFSPKRPSPRSTATRFAPSIMRWRCTRWPTRSPPTSTAIATFADWWGYKDEAWDAIPWNAVMSMRKGVRVALKSDSDDHIRRLNQEAGKMVHYGGATEDEAIRMVTLNPAWIIGVDDRIGSIDVGKDADLVLWNTIRSRPTRGPEGLHRRRPVLRRIAARLRHHAFQRRDARRRRIRRRRWG